MRFNIFITLAKVAIERLRTYNPALGLEAFCGIGSTQPRAALILEAMRCCALIFFRVTFTRITRIRNPLTAPRHTAVRVAHAHTAGPLVLRLSAHRIPAQRAAASGETREVYARHSPSSSASCCCSCTELAAAWTEGGLRSATLRLVKSRHCASVSSCRNARAVSAACPCRRMALALESSASKAVPESFEAMSLRSLRYAAD